MEAAMARVRTVRTREAGEGPYSQVIVAGAHAVIADEPAQAGGRGIGPDPYELLLAALGACTAMTVRMYADRHAYPLDTTEVELRHVQHIGVDGVATDRFDREILLKGELTQEQRARLIEIAGRCPVSQTLSRGAQVTAVERTEPWLAADARGAPASDAGAPAA
jgi:putative redox protein